MSGMALHQYAQPPLQLVPPPEPKNSSINPFTPEDITCSVIDYHDYQKDAISQILNGFFIDNLKTQRLIMPTGCGKTIIFNGVAKVLSEMDYRVLVLVHRNDLLRQADTKMHRIGLYPLIEQGDRRALTHFFGDKKIVVASVQSMHSDRVRLWPRDSFDFIISDEAHHVRWDNGKNGNHWSKVVRWFHAQHLGVTATPGYTTKIEGKRRYVNIPGWQRDIEPITMLQAIERGFLAPMVFKKVKTNIDLRNVGRVFGQDSDFKQNELDRVIYDNTNKLATAVKENIGNRPTIVFTPLIASSEALANALNDIGVTAIAISGETKNPEVVYADHELGKYQVMVNACKLTEGFDAPYVECVVIAKPTQSVNAYRQMVGRGTRTFHNEITGYKKENCLIVDFAYVTGDLPLVGGVEFLKEKLKNESEEDIEAILEAADEFMNNGNDVTLDDALEAAKLTVEEQKEKERIRAEIEARKAAELEARRLKNKEKKFRYEVTTLDPFHINLLGIPEQTMNDLQGGEKATDKQKATIERMTKGRVKTDGMSKNAARAIIGQLIQDREAGMATYAQRETMTKRLGAANITIFEAQNLTMQEATDYISANKTW